jgi:hypothetical protein
MVADVTAIDVGLVIEAGDEFCVNWNAGAVTATGQRMKL